MPNVSYAFCYRGVVTYRLTDISQIDPIKQPDGDFFRKGVVALFKMRIYRRSQGRHTIESTLRDQGQTVGSVVWLLRVAQNAVR